REVGMAGEVGRSGPSRGGSGSPRKADRSAGERAAKASKSPARTAEARPMTGVSVSSEMGSTRIGDGVVTKIAGLAARDIPGVFSMGSSMARRVGQIRSMIPGGSEAVSQGVSVEVGEKEAAVDLNIVTWYG